MKIVFRKEIIHSSKKDKDFYIVRICLIQNDTILAQSNPLLWLKKEDYDNLNL